MNRRVLTETERLDWLRLSRTENVGPITFRQLLRRFGTARAALDALPQMAQRGGKKNFKLPDAGSIEKEIEAARKIGAKILGWCEPEYSEALAAIEDAPPLITLRGHASLMHKRSIGIVGSRNASLNGRKMAENLARELGAQNIAVTSGLARGIDAAAHEASLATGTIAVVAGGVDVIYPEENRDLYERITAQGCILSDMPLGVEPHAKLFPRRNRLISGLSLGVVVVEAALKSGSLITARMALEQGREVFAVPGSPLDPRCTGTNDLLRQGAVLTEKADDILTHIHSMPKMLAEPPANDFGAPTGPMDERELDSARAKILENLSPSPVSVDELVRECHLSPSVVLTVLLELELAGRIERQAGHKVVLLG
ncbi:MAG: DNA-processing protein DprA [Alphaproteobacteria bacterium]|nr:DNA-processing protein DprA [Alphaproteobacteria bacterium]